MATNKVPEVLNDFRVYLGGSDNCIGVANIELPELSSMTQSITGIGVAGEVDAPILGHYQSMETTLTWRTPTPVAMSLASGSTVDLEARGAIQQYDSGDGAVYVSALKVVIRGRTKSTTQGTLEAGNTTDSSNTIETTYIKIEIDGETIREIDKYGYKDVVNGTDNLSAVREALGMV